MKEPLAPRAALTFEAIQAVDDLPTREIAVPQWGGVVYARPMTVAEQEAMATYAKVGDGNGGVRVDEGRATRFMVHVCLTAPVLSLEQVDALWAKSASAMKTIIDGLGRLNGFGQQSKEELEALFRA